PLRPPPRSSLFPYTTLFRSFEVQRFFRGLGRGNGVLEFVGVGSGQEQMEGRVVGAELTDVRQHGGFWGRETIAHPERDCVGVLRDRKSTRLNSSHLVISYAV